jgi:hypothetical protein
LLVLAKNGVVFSTHAALLATIAVTTAGAAFFQVVTPEPQTLMLVGTGLLAIVLYSSRFRDRNQLRRKSAT